MGAPRCGKPFVGAPHPNWKAQGYSVQGHTCDLLLGHQGPCSCLSDPTGAVSATVAG